MFQKRRCCWWSLFLVLAAFESIVYGQYYPNAYPSGYMQPGMGQMPMSGPMGSPYNVRGGSPTMGSYPLSPNNYPTAGAPMNLMQSMAPVAGYSGYGSPSSYSSYPPSYGSSAYGSGYSGGFNPSFAADPSRYMSEEIKMRNNMIDSTTAGAIHRIENEARGPGGEKI